MTNLTSLDLGPQESADLSCNGRNFSRNASFIESALLSCGAAGSPCNDNATACPFEMAIVPPTAEPPSDSATLGAGAIAGIAVGSVAVVGIGVYVGFS